MSTPRKSLRDSDEDLLSVFSFLAQPEIAAPTPQDFDLSNTNTATLSVNPGIYSSYESMVAATSEIEEAIPKSRRTILSVNTGDNQQELYSSSPRSGAPSPSHHTTIDRHSDRYSVASHSSVNSNASSSSAGTLHHDRKSAFTYVTNSSASGSDRVSVPSPRLTGTSVSSVTATSDRKSSNISGSTSHESRRQGATQVAQFNKPEIGQASKQSSQHQASAHLVDTARNHLVDTARNQGTASPMSVSTTGIPASITDRKSTLLYAPQTLQQHVNSGDFDKLRDFVYDACHDSCTFQSSSMTSEVVGKQKFLEFFWSITQACPDFLLVINRTQYNTSKNVVIAMMESSGCKLFSNQSEHLFNTIRFGPPDCIEPRLKQQALDIEKTGKHYKFVTDIVMLLFLNADCTKIQHVRMTLSITGISISSD